MINLMPDQEKKEIRAARVNVLLIRYMVVILLACLFLGFILVGSFYLLGQTKQNAQALIETNDVKASVYSETKTQVDSLSQSLSGARTILDQEILYSNVLVNFAQLMPTGTVIDKITLDSTSFGATPLTFTVYAKTTADAIALRDRFQSSALFSDVNFQTISDSSSGIPGYPISATMKLSIQREAAK